jgi:hypothetical protein
MRTTLAIGVGLLAFAAIGGFVAAPAAAEPLPADGHAWCTASLPPRCEVDVRVLDENIDVQYP